VRLINGLVTKKTWESFNSWISNNLIAYKNIRIVGFGGNINKIYKISGVKIGSPLPIKKLNSVISKLEMMSDLDKTLILKLNPDRIDVIVPAGKIYQLLLNSIGVNQIEVPKIGLADGMVSELLNGL
jgi:exopolyphosphatase/guanosine-5'-triphosphate,3'-diphosphate pyrophosphatase